MLVLNLPELKKKLMIFLSLDRVSSLQKIKHPKFYQTLIDEVNESSKEW